MRTIEIKDITNSYEQERILHNQKILSQYGKDIGNAPYSHLLLNFNAYKRLISMIIEFNDKSILEVKFGITSTGEFVKLFPEINIPSNVKLSICDRIDTFFRIHRNEFIEGEDILKIVINDIDNLLKYSFRDEDALNSKKKKNFLSKILKRGYN